MAFHMQDTEAPVNIKRLVRQNAQYEEARQFASSVRRGTLAAEWFQRDFQNMNKPELTAQTEIIRGKETSVIERHKTSLKDQIAQEVHMANETVRMQRKQCLRELIQRETRMYERELNAMGLALSKYRP